MHKRADKVAEAIHEEISALLVKGIKDPRIGFVTLTGVKMTDDMHMATVYFTVIGTEEERKASAAGLNSAKGYIRKELGKHLHMRYLPDITFKYDESVEYGYRIEGLIRQIQAADNGHADENS